MKPDTPQALGKTSGLAIGIGVAGSLAGLYLVVGILFTLDVRIYRSGFMNFLPGYARVGLVRAYTPFLRTLRLSGVLPPVVSPRHSLWDEISMAQDISVRATAGGCAGALGGSGTKLAAMGEGK